MITSGKTVHGFDSNFPSQLAVGDHIILMTASVDDAEVKEKERRRVNMVLSAKSCGLEEAFTEDIIDKVQFWVQRRPKKKDKVRSVDEVVRDRMLARGQLT